MKEIGILYSTEMVRAKLEDRKSMTRRPWGLEEINKEPNRWEFVRFHDGYAKFCEKNNWTNEVYVKCPYGQPGDLHWVKETHYKRGKWEIAGKTKTGKGKMKFVSIDDDVLFDPFFKSKGETFWLDVKPNSHIHEAWYKRLGRFMFKKDARIWDEVVSVRAEMLQDMDGATADECDSLKEGIHKIHQGDGNYGYSAFTNEPSGKNWVHPLYAFRELWANINGPDSWNHNPWVWVIETKNISKTGKPS